MFGSVYANGSSLVSRVAVQLSWPLGVVCVPVCVCVCERYPAE